MPAWAIKDEIICLASASQTRAHMLRSAGVVFECQPAHIDEQAIKEAGIAEGISPDDIVVTLAEIKGQTIAYRQNGFVIGCDQLLSCAGVLYSKPENIMQAAKHLSALSGQTHRLHTAVVLFHRGRRIWHYCSHADLTMRPLSSHQIDEYLAVSGQEALSTPGCYQIESGGAHLFTKMTGVYYDILGLPLLPLLGILREHGLTPLNSEI